MKKILIYLATLLCLVFAAYGCGAEVAVTDDEVVVADQESVVTDDEAVVADQEAVVDDVETDDADEAEEASDDVVTFVIDREGSYTTPEDVALYIHTYGELPQNFITKQEAEELGWNSKEGNLDEVAPGMSIGGNRFGNYEQLLPDGDYKECDVNYSGGYRGDERIVYDEDGDIYYTDDHYATFTQLYSSEE